MSARAPTSTSSLSAAETGAGWQQEIDEQLRALQQQITAVEEDIRKAEAQLEKCPREERVYWMKEKEQLRDKEKQLRDERLRLMPSNRTVAVGMRLQRRNTQAEE